MGGEKKGVKRFKKGVEKARRKGDVSTATKFNKGARSRPQQQEKEMEDVETADNVIQVKKHEKKVGGVTQHKQDLQGLEEMDPEFFNFLKKNDSSLLDFGMDEEEDDDMDLEEESIGNSDDDEDEDDTDSDEEEVKEKAMITVTEELLTETLTAAQDGSLAALKRSMAIFRAACMPYGDDKHTSENLDEIDDRKGSSRYQIPSAAIFELTLQRVLEGASQAFYAALGLKTDKLDRGSLDGLGKSPKWKRVQLLVLSFFKSFMTVLGGVARSSVSSKDDDEREENPSVVAVYLLGVLDAYIPLLVPLPRLSKALMKILLYIWSEGPEPTQDPHQLRARAYLRIRQMAIKLPGAYAEECFRCLYLTFSRVGKTFTEFNGPNVMFMIRCIVELYQTDIVQAYQQGFLYIRQLALHLRTSVMKKTSDNVRLVTSWQFLNCLRLWTRVISALPADNELGALAFPLSQIIYGVMAVAQSVYLLPLRFHLISCLQLLAANCRLFIPTGHKLLEILELPDLLQAKATPSTEVAPRLQYCVKLPAGSVTRAAVRDILVQEAITLIRNDAEVYRYSAGFPEYIYLTIRKLKAFAKAAKVSKWRDMARTTVSQLESFDAEAKRLRTKLGRAPSEVTEFEPLLPSGGASSIERLSKLLKGRDLTATSDIAIPTPAAAEARKLKIRRDKEAEVSSSSEEEDEDEVANSEDDDEEEDEEDDDEDSDLDAGVKTDRLKKLDMGAFFE